MRVADSERLSYHFVTADDARFLWEIDQDEAVMKYLNGGTKTSWETLEKQFLPRIAEFSDESRGWGLWRVSLKQSPRTDLGWILVRPYGFFTGERDDNNLELGWRFHRAAWGKGYATEAARQVRDSLFQHGTRQFCAIAMPENAGSIGVMKNLGMTYSHTHRYIDAIFDEDVVVYQQNMMPARPLC